MLKKRILITGSTDGIGKETARRLAGKNHEIIIHGRHANRVQNTVEALKQDTGNDYITGETADFAKLKEVKRMSLKLKDKYDSLEVLLNNAGIINPDFETTVDGFEKSFQVNYLAPFVLTNNLLPLMKSVGEGRIVNVSSMIHASNIDLNDLELRNNYSGSAAYAATKLYNILFTFKLARLLRGGNIACNCFHPGVINTKLLRSNFGNIGGPISEGADNAVFLAVSPEAANKSGKYFRDSHVASPAQVAEDRQIQDKLWNMTMEMVSNYIQDHS